MVDAKGKKLVQGPELPKEEAPIGKMLRLCIRCKDEMTNEDWGALFLNMPEEAKK